MEKILNFYNEDGTLKDKKKIDKMVDDLYIELEHNEAEQGNITYYDELISPEMQFSNETAKENNDFLRRNLYISEPIMSTDYGDILGGAPHNSIAQEVMEKIIMYNDIDDELDIPKEDRRPIYLYINTDGGEITEAFQLIDTIMLSKTPVITIGSGKVYSAGLLIFLAADQRITFDHASYLLHEGSSNFGGDAQKFDNWADFYKNKIRRQMKDFVVSRTKISSDDYDTMKKDDMWFTAKEALDKGIATDSFKGGLL